ncbi:MAG: hypothetical protein KIS92_01535 [Planctomycetota bacterium]|nr:hypothetical protein [Planctomycetota bacterium]
MSEAGDRRKTRSHVPITAPREKPASAALPAQRVSAPNEAPPGPPSPQAHPVPPVGGGRQVPPAGSGRQVPPTGSGRQRPPYPPRPAGAQPGVPDSSTRHYQMSPSAARLLREPEQTRRIDPKSISIRGPGGGLSARPTAMSVGCKQCGRPLPPEILNRLPIRASAALLCPACEIINAEKRRVQRRNLIAAAACAGLAIAGVGAVFPQPALFILALAGFVSISAGVLGFTWERVVRLALVAGGLTVMCAAVALLWTLQDRAAEQAAEQDVREKTAAIAKLLEENRFLEAHEACERLQVEVREQGGAYDSNEVRGQVANARQELDQWVERRYEGLTAEGRQLLLGLLRLFPATPGAHGQRVRGLQVKGNEITLTMVLPADLSSVTARTGDPRSNAARMILVSIFDGLPNVDSVWLTLVPPDDAAGSDAGGTYIVKKDQAISLRMGELPQREEDRPK